MNKRSKDIAVIVPEETILVTTAEMVKKRWIPTRFALLWPLKIEMS